MGAVQDTASPANTWIYKGPQLTVRDNNIWDAIARGLSHCSEGACLKCDGVTFSPKELLHTINYLINILPVNSRYQRIGINISRSATSVITTLALWKNRSIYVPLAVEYPLAKIAEIAERCDLALIISDRPLTIGNYYISATHLVLNQSLYLLSRKRDGFVSGAYARDCGICYIAHTSGSTGAPKGVKISHRALINRIASMSRFLQVSKADVCLYKTSLCFDVHIWEFVLPLACGCSLVVYPQSDDIDLFSIAELITAEKVTIVGFVPSLLNMALDIESLVNNNALRAVLCGGEAWAPVLAKKFYSKLPDRKLYNSYGPTETTIAVANWLVPINNLDKIYLGEPLDNLSFMIEGVEKVNTLESEAIIGMLCIGGIQVGDGYVNAQDDGVFFSKIVDDVPTRFYRTGDRVRLDLHTGLASFIGRDDNQVKIHGMRMELEEVESVIAEIDHVESCVVVVINDGPTPRLHASFKAVDDIPVDVRTLKEACQRRLPRTFVPFWFKQVRTFPLKANGKVDRAAILHAVEEEQSLDQLRTRGSR